jgi:hypothetical protein
MCDSLKAVAVLNHFQSCGTNSVYISSGCVWRIVLSIIIKLAIIVSILQLIMIVISVLIRMCLIPEAIFPLFDGSILID